MLETWCEGLHFARCHMLGHLAPRYLVCPLKCSARIRFCKGEQPQLATKSDGQRVMAPRTLQLLNCRPLLARLRYTSFSRTFLLRCTGSKGGRSPVNELPVDAHTRHAQPLVTLPVAARRGNPRLRPRSPAQIGPAPATATPSCPRSTSRTPPYPEDLARGVRACVCVCVFREKVRVLAGGGCGKVRFMVV